MQYARYIVGLLVDTTLAYLVSGQNTVENGGNNLLISETTNVTSTTKPEQNITPENNNSCDMMLFDFTTLQSVDNWMEISDTVRTVGKSKAVLALQTTQVFQRGIFFTLLNPQSNGAGFAGVRTRVNLDLSNYKSLAIKCRAQGNNDHYKMVLRHKGQASNEDITYEQFFMVPLSEDELSTIRLPLANFEPYYRGRKVPDAEPLNTTDITMIGLQIYGGVYSPIKQNGVSSLEIDFIFASC